MIIYAAKNKKNNKMYIGQTTVSLEQRIKGHIVKEPKSLFHKAIKKNGIDGFDWFIICECLSKEEMDEKEKYYIKKFNSYVPNGYNLTFGGEGSQGRVLSEDTKEKIRKTKIGKTTWNRGLTKEIDDRVCNS